MAFKPLIFQGDFARLYRRFSMILALMTIFPLRSCESPAMAYKPIISYSRLYHKQDITYYKDSQYTQAIFWTEGGYHAKYAYGIRSIKYTTIKEAKRICLRTVRNNRKRYKEYGYKYYPSYLQFLASVYCPTTGAHLTRSEKHLNKNWLHNMEYYLRHPRSHNA